MWRYEPDELGVSAGYAVRALTGHSQPIQDLSLSSNGKYGLTGSWGKPVLINGVYI